MPSQSPAQHRLMAGVARDPQFAAKVGIPQSVGQEFAQADAPNSPKALKRKALAGAILRKR